ncbi:hypothetical protein M2161_006001 [Streptomyces sp. SAI-133]|uniref:hypothetical protein n=1 Tax=unclassified Streptomyces TaxID=2593676 RepID=UPI002474782E|nr:hypothetical protein [Streptomyces sp. SAI-133]MDH6586895.1 hypothetical protein [Streptomyces sp. SAI-133]
MCAAHPYDVPHDSGAATIALCDESMRHGQGTIEIYMLSAVVVPLTELTAVRDHMSGLRMPGQRKKLHWRDESARRRALAAGELAALRADIVIATSCGISHDKQERARRKALETLLLDLGRRCVRAALLESRGPERDRADVSSLAGLRKSGILPPSLRVDHRVGRDEPALWAADIAAGAYGAAVGGTPEHWEAALRGCKGTVLTCGSCGRPHAPGAAPVPR